MHQIIQHRQFAPRNLVYGFLGVHPDISTHRYREHKEAEKNREKVLKILDCNQSYISILKQVHGVRCAELNSSEDIDYDYEGDAQITKSRDIILATQTADCVPVLFCDQLAGVVGAAHAGWRGALDGVLNSTLRGMKESGANLCNITAVIGPCIRQDSYEVDRDFIDRFLFEDIQNSKFFERSESNMDKYFFDLPGYVAEVLVHARVQQIFDVKINTFNDPRFFSYRRSCLAKKELSGYNLSLIGLQ